VEPPVIVGGAAVAETAGPDVVVAAGGTDVVVPATVDGTAVVVTAGGSDGSTGDVAAGEFVAAGVMVVRLVGTTITGAAVNGAWLTVGPGVKPLYGQAT
jgi:hypothetical protein